MDIISNRDKMKKLSTVTEEEIEQFKDMEEAKLTDDTREKDPKVDSDAFPHQKINGHGDERENGQISLSVSVDFKPGDFLENLNSSFSGSCAEVRGGLKLPLHKQENQKMVCPKSPKSGENVYLNTPADDEKENSPNGHMKTNGQAELHNTFQRSATDIPMRQISFDSTKPSFTKSRTPGSRRRGFCRSKSYSREELERYLPRKSFFSCHDKILRDSGYDVEDRERMKNKPNWKLILEAFNVHPKEYTTYDALEEVAKENRPRVGSLGLDDTFEEESEGGSLPRSPRDVVDGKQKKGRTKKKDDSEEIIKVDYKPLLRYLKYVQENPTEYSTMTQFHNENTDYKHADRLVRAANAYRRTAPGRRNSIVLHAVDQLKQRFCDPGQWSHSKDKSQTQNILGFPTKKEAVAAPTKQEASDAMANTDENKTEMEKEKIRVEKWVKTLPTADFLKAKELALKELGEEDKTTSKWWLVFKSCNYIRQREFRDSH